MTSSAFAVPQTMEPALARLHAYWNDLARGENPMPFSDDIVLSQVPGPEGGLVLVQAFENPERFRFEHVGERVAARIGRPLAGIFTDEAGEEPPLDGFTAQCSATVGTRAPTYRRAPDGHARLLLPTWGEGHVLLLLGAVETGAPGR